MVTLDGPATPRPGHIMSRDMMIAQVIPSVFSGGLDFSDCADHGSKYGRVHVRIYAVYEDMMLPYAFLLDLQLATHMPNLLFLCSGMISSPNNLSNRAMERTTS